MIYVLLIIFVLLTGCSEQANPSGEQTLGTDSQPQGQEQQLTPQNIVPAGNSNGVATDDGYYSTLNHRVTINTTYHDFATMQNIILCSDINCTHDDESCEAYLTGNFGFNVVAALESGELITISTGDVEGITTTTISLSDATNRHIRDIATIEGHIRLLGLSDDRIYLVQNEIYYISIDIATGQMLTIYTDNTKAAGVTVSLQFYGSSYVVGDGIYLLSYDFGDNANEIVSYDDLPEEVTVRLQKVDVATGIPQDIYSETVSTATVPSYYFLDDELFILSQEGNSAFNLTTGEITQYPQPVADDGEQLFSTPMFLIDGYMTFNASAVNNAEGYLYHLNLETKEVVKSTLSYEMSLDVNFSVDAPIMVLEDLGDELLVVVSEQVFVYEEQAPDGPFMVRHAFNDTALIDEADYFANNANYRPFDSSTITAALLARD